MQVAGHFEDCVNEVLLSAVAGLNQTICEKGLARMTTHCYLSFYLIYPGIISNRVIVGLSYLSFH